MQQKSVEIGPTQTSYIFQAAVIKDQQDVKQDLFTEIVCGEIRYCSWWFCWRFTACCFWYWV